MDLLHPVDDAEIMICFDSTLFYRLENLQGGNDTNDSSVATSVEMSAHCNHW